MAKLLIHKRRAISLTEILAALFLISLTLIPATSFSYNSIKKKQFQRNINQLILDLQKAYDFVLNSDVALQVTFKTTPHGLRVFFLANNNLVETQLFPPKLYQHISSMTFNEKKAVRKKITFSNFSENITTYVCQFYGKKNNENKTLVLKNVPQILKETSL